MKKILVLGASGFIGKSLCFQLADKYQIKAYDRTHINDFQCHPNIECITGDFTKELEFKKIVADIDWIIHLISTTVPCVRTDEIPKEIMQNVFPTVRLLETAIKMQNPPKILFVSSGGTIYGEGDQKTFKYVADEKKPMCAYGMQKSIIEEYILFYSRYYGIEYNIARISNVYGYDKNLKKKQGIIPIYIRNILDGKEITIFGDGNNVRDYIYLDDVIAALETILDKNNSNQIYNIGTGIGYSVNEIVELIERLAGRKFVRVNFTESRKCDINYNVLDILETKKDLLWVPYKTLEDGIKEILIQMEENQKDTTSYI
ncbi:MAG: NAD-dependent epimerase/dehydratase family protein [Clostridiaceae bacterium]|nr:NAD-dependent epimerase/dehydratase family protein [Clostridiaceae bacterium]